MAFEKGSLVLIDYTAKIKDSEEIFETTLNEDAKNLQTYDSTIKYEPRLVSIGEGWVIRGLDEVLANANQGDTIDVEIPPDKAFGERDQTKIRMVPLRKLGEKGEELKPGDIVDVDERRGIVRFIGSGRVQIDFNHRLAGRTLSYNVKVLKKLDTSEEKVSSLIRRRLPIETDKIKIVIEGNSLDVAIPSESLSIEGIQIVKRAITSEIFRFLPTVETIKFTDVFIKPKEATDKKAEATDKKAEATDKKAEATDKKAEATDKKAEATND
jgi:peptidylprolyl isomerase